MNGGLAPPVGVVRLAADGWAMRTARAGVFAACSVALAAGAHRLGGGAPPTRAVLVIASAVLFGFGLLWARRERHGPAIAAVVLLSQLALHATFASMRSMAGDRANGELNRWAAMLLCHNPTHPATAAQVNAARAALGLGPLPTAPPAMHMASPFTAGGGAMVALHLGAALVMACWLRRGERAVWAAARQVVAAVVAAGRPVLRAPAPRATARAAGTVWAPRRWTFGAGVTARGPPPALLSARTA